MRRNLLLVIAAGAAVLFGSAAAQEPVPAFQWHSDASVVLPPGTLALAEDPCFGLFAEMGLFEAEPKHCYLILDDEGAREFLVEAFLAAGYTVVAEVQIDEQTFNYTFQSPTGGSPESVTLLYSDGSLFVLGYL